MGRVWVLDTETKGTGAEMVPLERVHEQSARRGRHPVRAGRPAPPPSAPPAPRQPHRFRVVDVMSERVLAEDAGTRATLDLLDGVRSVVDVRVYVWEPEAEDWRALTFGEQKRLWELRRGGDAAAAERAR